MLDVKTFSFHAPLLAATIEGDLGQRRWMYCCAASKEEAQFWAKETLTIHQDALSEEDFVPKRNMMKLPYPTGPFKAQYFGVDLLCMGGDRYCLLLHGTHAIFDGQVTLDATHCLLNSLTAPNSEPDITMLEWGTEWKNLPTDIITAIGGAPDGAKEGVPTLSKEIRDIVENPKVRLSHSSL
jgi:hypothetical protein